MERHSQGSPGGGLGPQEKQVAIFGAGKRRRGGLPQESPSLNRHGLSEGRVPLAQAAGGKRPLAWAMGDWVPLVWAKGSEG